MNEIESLSITDDEGRAIPYTIKSYPRKRIFWEYGPPKNNLRNVKINFTIRQGVKKSNGLCTFEIDWIGGWTREVRDVTYSITFPFNLTQDDLIYISPNRYKLTAENNLTRLNFSFPLLETKTLKIVYKDKEVGQNTRSISEKPTIRLQAKSSSQPQKDILDHKIATSVSDRQQIESPQKLTELHTEGIDSDNKTLEQVSITNIRHSIQNATCDRIVFDMTKRLPYEFHFPEDSSEAEILWSVPISIAGKARIKKTITSPRISGIRWRKTSDKKTSCLIELTRKNLSISHGILDKPPRIYIDITEISPQTQTVTITRTDSLLPLSNNTTVAISQTPPLFELPPVQYKQTSDNTVQPTVTQTFFIPQVVASTSIPAPPEDTLLLNRVSNLEEKTAYQKAKKLYEVGEFENAIHAYERLLRQYPNTILAENILYDIADAAYSISEQREPKNYNDAIQAYKNALVNYPDSPRASYASFQIAQCHHKVGFYIEAASQYDLVIQRYPGSPYVPEAKFWLAECLFQMHKFEDALREFEKFSREFPTGPHARDAAFRIADCYAELKDFERAEFYYDKAMKRWPDIIDLPVSTLNNIAMTNYYKGKFEKSREFFLLSFNLYGDQKERERLLRFVGDSYQWEGDMQKAMNIYGLILDMFPETEEAALAVMRIADLGVNVSGLKGDQFSFKDFNPYKEPEKAYRWITMNAKTPDVLSEAYYKLGFTLAKHGNLPEAVDFFKKAMSQRSNGMYYAKSFENIQKILIKMIHTAVEQGDYSTVVETYKKNESVFLKNIDDCMFFYDVAKSYTETGIFDYARPLLEKILLSASNIECSQKAAITLSSIDISHGNIEKARERLQLLLNSETSLIGATMAEAYHMLGDTYFFEKKFDQAIEYYSRALQNTKELPDVRDITTLYRMAEAFGRTGYHNNGIQTLKKLLSAIDRLPPKQRKEVRSIVDDALLMTGELYVKKSDYASAMAVFRDVIQRSTNDQMRAWAYIKWGETLMRQGMYDNATRVFQEFTITMPNSYLIEIARSHIDTIKWSRQNQAEIKKLL